MNEHEKVIYRGAQTIIGKLSGKKITIPMEGIAAYVPDSGEGRWTVVDAIELNCSIPVITLALQRRFRSREESPFADRLLAAMRQQFGGHAVKRES